VNDSVFYVSLFPNLLEYGGFLIGKAAQTTRLRILEMDVWSAVASPLLPWIFYIDLHQLEI